MVCTTAFGMGVDVLNIEIVVRLGCPQTLRNMYRRLEEQVEMANPQKVI